MQKATANIFLKNLKTQMVIDVGDERNSFTDNRFVRDEPIAD